MENAYPLDVPLRVEVKSGRNWLEVTPVNDDDADAESLVGSPDGPQGQTMVSEEPEHA